MLDLEKFTLIALRKLYCGLNSNKHLLFSECEVNPDEASEMIYNVLANSESCMIARFGGFELDLIINYLGVKANKKNVWRYIKNEQLQWWWNKSTLNYMYQNAGFFPITYENIEKFCVLMLEDMKHIDILGSWLEKENYITDKINNVKKVKLVLLEPYLSENPWTKVLANKKVLVVHPFAELIKEQYKKREYLFENKDILPEFHLKTIKAVQSFSGCNNDFNNWFDALDWMKDEISKHDYDICLIGCGAYGFPLAAHVKREGKKAIHLGGALQLLFGIKGKRWENPNYNEIWNLPDNFYLNLMQNPYWVRPTSEMIPKDAHKIEGSCYW